MKLFMKLTMREPTFMGSMTTDRVITTCGRLTLTAYIVKVTESWTKNDTMILRVLPCDVKSQTHAQHFHPNSVGTSGFVI